MGNGGDLSRKREKPRQEKVGSIAAKPNNLEISKEAGGEAQGTYGLSEKCTRGDRVCPLFRV